MSASSSTIMMFFCVYPCSLIGPVSLACIVYKIVSNRNHHAGNSAIWDGMRYLREKERWDAYREVPRRNRIECLPMGNSERKGCGKERRKGWSLPGNGFKNNALPQADILGWEWNIAVLLEEIFIFLSLHHFAMHYCLAIQTSTILYINIPVFAWHK